MSLTSSPIRQVQAAFIDEDENERRVHRRYAVTQAGRFMCPDKGEYDCRVVDISVGGLALSVDGPIPKSIQPGGRVVAYIGQLGGLEGTVLRTWDDGFAMKINATQHKREKLAAQITWLLNEGDMSGAAARQHERLKIANRDADLTLVAGGFIPCLILDVSLSGASLACKARPDLGDEVWLSRLRARVVRHHSEGIGIQFMEVLDAQDMQAHFG
jgi:hypothetical protein